MTQDDSTSRLSIVELAMARSSGRKVKPDTPSPTVGVAGRLLEKHPQDVGLPCRLHPIRAGLGEINPPVQEESLHAEIALATGTRPLSDYVFRIASHLIAAAAGAALMWNITDNPVPTQDPNPPETTVAVATIAPDVAVTPPVSQPPLVALDAQVRDRLEQWRQSWSNRDVESYLGFYSVHFVAANGVDRSVWAESRRKNFQGKTSINVQIHDVTVIPTDNNQVKVTLLQDYTSDNYKEIRQPKTFRLSREGGDWQIIGEWQGFR